MNYGIVGYGRMGAAIDSAARARGHALSAVVRRGESIDRRSLEGVEVAFEFTDAGAAERNVHALLDAGVAVVCGTTGWTPSDALRRVAAQGPVGMILAPNFAVGVQLFFRLVERAAAELAASGGFDCFVHEAHHRDKRDAPSGTARELTRRVESGKRRTPAADRTEIPVTSVRGGAEPGRHTVGFEGDHELILLEHRARGREGFASGAVLAAEWLCGRSGDHRFESVIEALLAEGLEEGERRR